MQNPANHGDPQPTPWYKPSWLWLVIGLPAATVVAGLLTVYIAFANKDDDVRDDVSKTGFAIQQDTQLLDQAKALGVQANIEQDKLTGEIFITLSFANSEAAQPSTENLTLDLIHPTNSDQDLQLTLTQVSTDRYRADLTQPLTGKRTAWITATNQWRLTQEINF